MNLHLLRLGLVLLNKAPDIARDWRAAGRYASRPDVRAWEQEKQRTEARIKQITQEWEARNPNRLLFGQLLKYPGMVVYSVSALIALVTVPCGILFHAGSVLVFGEGFSKAVITDFYWPLAQWLIGGGLALLLGTWLTTPLGLLELPEKPK